MTIEEEEKKKKMLKKKKERKEEEGEKRRREYDKCPCDRESVNVVGHRVPLLSITDITIPISHRHTNDHQTLAKST